jgi:hypothetical protein
MAYPSNTSAPPAEFSLANLFKGPDIQPVPLPVSRFGAAGTSGRSGVGTAAQWTSYRQAQARNAQLNRKWVNDMMGGMGARMEELSAKQEGLLDQSVELFGEAREGMKPLEADYEGEMMRAESDVGQEFAQSREATTRGLARYGLNPSSGRYVGAQRQVDIAEAGARAGGRTMAHRAEKARVEGGNFERAQAQARLVQTGVGLGQQYGEAAAGYGESMERFAATSGRGVTKRLGNKRYEFLTPLG